MAKKKLVLEFVFDEVPDEFDPDDFTYLEPRHVKLHKDTTMDSDELESLGDSIGQTDRWQVDNWIAIQSVMGGDTKKAKLR